MRFLFAIALLVGCVRDAPHAFPEPQTNLDTGHCQAMFAPGVLGCTYLTSGVLAHEICVRFDDASWWCSGTRTSSAPRCWLCDDGPAFVGTGRPGE